jgi:KDEL-tailed cysteine endopeptidase
MKGVSIALIALGAILIASTGILMTRQQLQNTVPAHIDEAFAIWRKRFGVAITNPTELNFRRNLFYKTFKFVEQHNSEGHSYEVEVGQFAILTPEEFKARHLGLKVPEKIEKRFLPENNLPSQVPQTVDWIKAGAVTAIKNQLQCGSCWAFSANDSIESIWSINGHTLVSVSEQQLVDCSAAFGNNGCNGGWMDNAFKYVIANKNLGIDSTSTYPYKGVQGTCAATQGTTAASITGYVDVAVNSNHALLAAVAQQPVSVAINASSSQFQNYKSGVFDYKGCSTQLDHGVGIVGYQNDSSASPTNYWVVRNSWGTSWGNQGYIWMSNTVNASKDPGSPGICGIQQAPSYATTTN